MPTKHQLIITAKLKGWLGVELAERWGMTPRHISRIAADPSQIHIDAVNGLPDRNDDDDDENN